MSLFTLKDPHELAPSRAKYGREKAMGRLAALTHRIDIDVALGCSEPDFNSVTMTLKRMLKAQVDFYDAQIAAAAKEAALTGKVHSDED